MSDPKFPLYIHKILKIAKKSNKVMTSPHRVLKSNHAICGSLGQSAFSVDTISLAASGGKFHFIIFLFYFAIFYEKNY